MATELYTFDATVSLTELSLTGGTSVIQARTDNGVMQLWIDVSAMVAGDVFRFKGYEKVGTVQRGFVQFTLTGKQSDANKPYAVEILSKGWDFTVEKVSGADRNIKARVMQA